MDRIGFIGLGRMGRPMATNMQTKGFQLTVYDLLEAPMRALEQRGAKIARHAGEVARASDVVITMLPNSPDVEAVLLGEGGVLEAAAKGTVIMDMSTVAPETTDRLHQAATAKGLIFVDAPVGRQAQHADRGESLFMVGAEADALERVRPLLSAMGTTVIHCGPPGAGIRMKLVNNYLVLVACQMNAEALTLGSKLGLPVERMLEVFNGTTATNGHLKMGWPVKVLAGDIEPGFTIELAYKDLSLGVEAAAKAGVPVFVGAAARECLGQARRVGDYARKDMSALLDVTALAAGIRPPRL
ncbi:MAG: NAD-binding protein [Proteobacteria bacterium]|nr:NAD-binding protein [Pseudomonadota bacterium]MBI3495709.1 NAD-binding protein [Pseudomonadota bacterium]